MERSDCIPCLVLVCILLYDGVGWYIFLKDVKGVGRGGSSI
jgi:hypothetical protein